jgi:hypothetical protein
VTVYTIGWLVWIGWFLLEEGIALAKGGSEATLSGHVWKWFGTSRKDWTVHPTPTPGIRARRFALLAFMAWLAVHFLTGGRF